MDRKKMVELFDPDLALETSIMMAIYCSEYRRCHFFPRQEIELWIKEAYEFSYDFAEHYRMRGSGRE